MVVEFKVCLYAQVNVYFSSLLADLSEDLDNLFCHGLLKHLEFQFWYFSLFHYIFKIKMSVLLKCVGNGYE